MKDEIKQKLLKEIEKSFLELRGWKDWEEYDKIRESSKGEINVRKELIEITIKETSKAKDEEFIKILDEKIKNHNCLESDSVCMSCWVCHHFFELKEEIKQKLEDLEGGK